jgi:hypothetical protein
MSPLVASELAALEFISILARQHFEIPERYRNLLAGLWSRGLVRLRRGDVWEITQRGKHLLDAGGSMQ